MYYKFINEEIRIEEHSLGLGPGEEPNRRENGLSEEKIEGNRGISRHEESCGRTRVSLIRLKLRLAERVQGNSEGNH